jgi:hypothetical protein
VLPIGAEIPSLAFSPDSRWLAVGTRGQGIWLWDTHDWQKPAQRLK